MKIRASLIALLLSCPALALAQPAPPTYAAPHVPARQGFYIGFSLGGGGLEFTDSAGDSSGRENSLSFTLLRLGGALSERLLVGANLGGWAKEFDDGTVTMVRVNGEATFYPVLNPQAVDVFVRGGVGTGQLGVETDFGDFEENGLSLQAGVGIEKKLGRSFALGLGLDWHYAKLTDDFSGNYWEAAAQFTWY